MMIVLEGPDNSGKSTLAKRLGKMMGRSVIPSGGPAKSEEEIADRVRQYNARDPEKVIYDRHPCVSQEIYRQFHGGAPVDPELVAGFYSSQPLIIYCVGRSMTDHVVKDHDTDEHLAMLEEQHENICTTYDAWAIKHATYVYRIGDSLQPLISLLTSGPNLLGDVQLFHEHFSLSYNGPPRALPTDVGTFRLIFLNEELTEYTNASTALVQGLSESPIDYGDYQHQLEQSLDALVDLVYVALGTSYLHGFDFGEAWRRVQAANMAKVRAASSEDSSRGSSYDVVKPEGWQPPDHSDLVEGHDLIMGDAHAG